MNNTDVSTALKELKNLFGEPCTTNKSLREQHGHDESGWETYPPGASRNLHFSGKKCMF